MLKYANSKKRKRIAQLASLIAILVMIWPTITFVKFIKESGVQSDYNSYLKNEIESNRELWFQNGTCNIDEKKIALYFNGEITEATETDLRNELKGYDKIKDFSLEISGNKNRSFDKISDAYDRAIKELDEKDNIISGLQTQIENLRKEISLANKANNTISFVSLSKDAKIKFNDLQYFGYAKMQVSKDFYSVDTIDVVSVKWKASLTDSIVDIKEKALLEWMKNEVKADTLVIKHQK